MRRLLLADLDVIWEWSIRRHTPEERGLVKKSVDGHELTLTSFTTKGISPQISLDA